MGRPRQAAQIIKLKGAHKVNPGRYKNLDNEPQPTKPLGKMPGYFNEDEAACWNELVEMTPAGVLFNADRWVVETACRLMAKFRQDWLSGAEFSQLVALMSRMGLSPADRSKIKVEKPKEDNPFDGM